MKCPHCSRLLRPPVGYAPPGKAQRRQSIEQIKKAAEKKQSTLGSFPNLASPKRPLFLLGITLFLAILGGLVLTSSFNNRQIITQRQRDPQARTEQLLMIYATALAHFHADTGRYPTFEEGGLTALIADPGITDWYGPYVSQVVLRDGWRQPFFYDQTNNVPILYSAGPDQTFQTDDDIHIPLEAFKPHPDFIQHDPRRHDPDHISAVKIRPEA